MGAGTHLASDITEVDADDAHDVIKGSSIWNRGEDGLPKGKEIQVTFFASKGSLKARQHGQMFEFKEYSTTFQGDP